jgi:transposase InsO family protein
MQGQNLLRARRYTQRPDRSHNGKVVTLRSNLRWCSDGLEFVCWNGDVIRATLIIDAHDCEIIAWRAVTDAGISVSNVSDMMLEAVEARFGGYRAPQPVEMLSDNGSPSIAKETRTFACQLGLKPCFTPVKSPQSNRNLRSLRQHAEARLCAGHAAARRRNRARLDRRMVRGLQREPPALGAEDALAARVHRSPNRNRLSVR